MSKRVKVGVIGIGAIGTIHADAYKATPEAELTAICDVSKERLSSQGDRLGVAQRFANYHDLLKSDVDAVSVCVGNVLHRDVAIAALKAGKHVLLEKPMAMNANQATDIAVAAKKARRVLQIAMVWRQAADVQLVREYVQNGFFGSIYHIRIVMLRRRGIPGLGGWFTTKSASGGGPMIDLGVHVFDAAMYMSGLWKPTHVSAMTYAKFGRNMKDYKYVSMWAGPPRFNGVCDVEDYSVGMIRFGKQATMSFEISWAGNTEETQFIDILGDKAGARVIDGKPLTIMTEHNGRPADISPKFDGNVNRFQQQNSKFVAACKGLRPPVVTGDEGVTTMKLIDAVYASGKAGHEVKL